MQPQKIRLSDGRHFAYYEFGANDGQPLIFCTGAGMSGNMAFAEPVLDSLGLRLLSLDRPGLGASDAHSTKSMQSWCHDTKELLVVLGVDQKPLALGFSQGAPFAYALAHAGVARSLAIVSGQDDFSDAQSFSQLPTSVRDFIQSVRSGDPAFREGFLKQADAKGFFDLIVSMSSPADQEVYTSEPFRSQYQKALEEGFTAGAMGYWQDLVNCLSAWPFRLEDITTPVHLWYGALDQNATHAPDLGRRQSQRLPQAKLTIVEDGGGSILWTHSEQILTDLIKEPRWQKH